MRANLYLLLEYLYPANCSLFRLSRQYFVKAVPEISGINQIRSIWSNIFACVRVLQTLNVSEYAPGKTRMIFPNFQNHSFCEKYLKETKRISRCLKQKILFWEIRP